MWDRPQNMHIQKDGQTSDSWREDIDAAGTPAKHRLLLRHSDELTAPRATQHAECLALHHQRRTYPLYYPRYNLDSTAVKTHIDTKHDAEYTRLVKQHRRQLLRVNEHEHEAEQDQSEANKRNIVIE